MANAVATLEMHWVELHFKSLGFRSSNLKIDAMKPY